MNIVQGVNFQVKDPVTIKDFSDSSQVPWKFQIKRELCRF